MTERVEWLAERRRGIGGSDAAAACGLSRWKSPLDLYYDKIGQALAVDAENADMRRGKILEPAVKQMYADATGQTIVTPAEIIRSEEYPFALANLDGITSGGCVVFEGKTARNRAEWGDPWTDDIPVEYLCQVQHYMAVTCLDMSHVAVLFGSDFEFAIYEVEGDREFQEMLMEQEAAFWTQVQNRTPPEPKTPADIARRWPISRPVSRVATKEELDVAAQLLAVKEYFRKLEDDKELLEAEVKRTMEDVEALTIGKETIVTWKTAKAAARFDSKKFQADHPELYSQYLNESAPSRRFLLKDKAKCLQIMKPLLRENLLSHKTTGTDRD